MPPPPPPCTSQSSFAGPCQGPTPPHHLRAPWFEHRQGPLTRPLHLDSTLHSRPPFKPCTSSVHRHRQRRSRWCRHHGKSGRSTRHYLEVFPDRRLHRGLGGTGSGGSL